MENHEKIFDQIKKAAGGMEQKEFPSVEKVWSRVADKLDKKVLTKQHNLWKKIAIAASVLLFVTVGYQIFKPQETIANSTNKIVVNKSAPPMERSQEQVATRDKEPQNPRIKPNAQSVLNEQLETPSSLAMEETNSAELQLPESSETESELVLKSKKANVPTTRSAKFQKGKAFDALGVQREDIANDGESDRTTKAKTIEKTQAPLVIVDGKAITGEDALSITTISEGIARIDPKDEKEIIVLKEPLYIINGHYYSEQELFGPNPTSPYAPLNQQEIETISVFQGEKAIANYGKRGEKGVVVIITKDRKPASKTKASSTQK